MIKKILLKKNIIIIVIIHIVLWCVLNYLIHKYIKNVHLALYIGSLYGAILGVVLFDDIKDPQ